MVSSVIHSLFLFTSLFIFINFTQGHFKYLVIFLWRIIPFYTWLYPLKLIVIQGSQGLKEIVITG